MPEIKVNKAPPPDQTKDVPQPLARMQTFARYRQGKSELPGCDKVIKLSSNESCFGPSEAAVSAYHEAAGCLHRYPDGSQSALRNAIARVHGIDPDRIICGNGSEEVIGLLIRCYLEEGDELLMSENHFLMCSIYGKGQGAKIVLAPEADYTISVDAILERVSPKTRLITIANPNNPTGTYLPRSEIGRLIGNVPQNVLILLDGAYAEYPDRQDYDDGLGWADTCANVIVTHSFSKVYGLAGMRIGWGYGPAAVIEVMNRMRTPFNTNAPALAAAAAAMGDQEHVKRTREHTARWQSRLREGFANMGLIVVPSVTNFYLLDFSSVDGKTAAGAASFLEQNGIIPRPGNDERFLRITVGTDAENEAVLETMARYLTS